MTRELKFYMLLLYQCKKITKGDKILKYSLNTKELPLMIFVLIFLVLELYIGASYSFLIPIGFACMLLFVSYYAYSIKKTFWHFLIIIPFLPPYFAVQLGSLPVFTAFRIILLVFIFDQLIIKNRIPLLVHTILKDKLTPIILIYSLGVMVPGILQFAEQLDTTALVGSFSIILEKVTLYYLIVMNINIEVKEMDKTNFLNKFLQTLCISAFILSILGIIEYITTFNIFNLLDISQINGISSSSSIYFRQGNLRVSTSFIHSLGYGLYLILLIPISFSQAKKYKNQNQKQFLFYSVLLFLLLANLFLTYSRSTLISLILVSFIVYFIFSNLKKKIILIYSAFFLLFPMIVFSLTSTADNIPVISTIGKNTKAISDTFFGTHLVENYGDNQEPFAYRSKLIEFAFKEQYGFENIFGKGVGFIRKEPLVFNIPELNPYGPTVSNSVDNYYVNVKLEQGWVGFITTILFLAVVLIFLLKYRKKNIFFTFLLISYGGYLFELTMVNELYTMQYFWILLALFSSYAFQNNKKELASK